MKLQICPVSIFLKVATSEEALQFVRQRFSPKLRATDSSASLVDYGVSYVKAKEDAWHHVDVILALHVPTEQSARAWVHEAMTGLISTIQDFRGAKAIAGFVVHECVQFAPVTSYEQGDYMIPQHHPAELSEKEVDQAIARYAKLKCNALEFAVQSSVRNLVPHTADWNNFATSYADTVEAVEAC